VLLFALLVLGPSILDTPGDFKGRVVVSHTDDDDNGRLLLALFKHLGLRHAALPSAYSAEELSKLRLNVEEDLILTASDPKDELLASFVAPLAEVWSWTTSNTIQACLRRHPRRIVQAVEGLCGMQGLAALLAVRSKVPEAPAAPAPPLFSADKSYILTGGVGSLGPHVALWMYQVRSLSSSILIPNWQHRTARGTSSSPPAPDVEPSRKWRALSLSASSTTSRSSPTFASPWKRLTLPTLPQ
jgi:hypothetical protein